MDLKLCNPLPKRQALSLLVSACAALGWASAAHSAQAFSVDSPWMTGDWGGARTSLLEQGIDIKLGYLGQSATLLRGGYSDHEHPTRYSDQFNIGAGIDLQKLWGWQDAEFGLSITNRNGHELGEKLDDPRAAGMNSTQAINGRGSVTRLSGLWISKGWLDDSINLKFGRTSVSDDFGKEDCVFQNLAFCGSQPGNYVNSIYNGPISQWSARLRLSITEELYAQIGAYNVNTSNLDNDNGFKLNTAGTNGTLVPVELVWSPKVNQLPGQYRLGYYHSNVNADDVYKDEFGQAAAISGNAYRSNASRHGTWLVARQQLTAHDGDASRGLTVTASASFYDRATTPVSSYQKVSLLYQGPFDARPADALGFGVARIHVSSRFLRNAETSNELNGLGYNDAGYLPEQHTMYVAEINYRIKLAQWLEVMPNLQYLKNPDGVREVANAVVFGMEVKSAF